MTKSGHVAGEFFVSNGPALGGGYGSGKIGAWVFMQGMCSFEEGLYASRFLTTRYN
jgi:hypothetical protein